jgi:hypothetical protein
MTRSEMTFNNLLSLILAYINISSFFNVYD